jgi:hypothetical protein
MLPLWRADCVPELYPSGAVKMSGLPGGSTVKFLDAADRRLLAEGLVLAVVALAVAVTLALVLGLAFRAFNLAAGVG